MHRRLASAVVLFWLSRLGLGSLAGCAAMQEFRFPGGEEKPGVFVPPGFPDGPDGSDTAPDTAPGMEDGPRPVPELDETAFRRVTPPEIFDDMDHLSLAEAALASRDYFRKALKGKERWYRLGEDTFGTRELAESTDTLLEILADPDPAAIRSRLTDRCRFYAAPDAKFTAYYEPELRASRTPTEEFRFPLYRKPPRSVLLRVLGRAVAVDEPKQIGETVLSSPPPQRPKALSRAMIDGEGLLDGFDLEIAWLSNPVDQFFLHVQGSGRLALADGTSMRVGVGGTNGLPYTSIGKVLLREGLLPKSQASAEGIKEWLHANPELRDETLFRNARYIYFREMATPRRKGPTGAAGVPLVAGRSLANDPKHVPRGVLAYIRTAGPKVSGDGKFLGHAPLARLAFSLDTGAAIRGAGRTDIFWGTGTRAGTEAGYMNMPGEFHILICGVAPVEGGAPEGGQVATLNF